VWITQVLQRASAVKRAFFICRRQAKRLWEQRMAPLPDHRMGPTLPFWSTAVDLLGPLLINSSVNKRSTGKAWGGHLCVHVDIPGPRGDSRDIPHGILPDGREEVHGSAWGAKRFQSNQGTQLVADGDMGLVGRPRDSREGGS
jgi:hypothetical protein